MVSRKHRFVVFLVVLSLIAVVAYAASFHADVDGNKKGTVDSLTIDLTKVLTADGNNGSSTNVVLPGQFTHYNGIVNVGTWTKEQIMTPSGNFVLKVTGRLAGRKTLVWLSKRNVFTVEIHEGNSMTGTLLTSKTIDQSFSSPTDKTIQCNQITANLQTGNSRQYTIIIRFDKYDGDGGDDGYTGYTIRVGAT
jgi:hypothetical protein